MSCVRVLNFQSYFVSWETERSLSKEKEIDSKTWDHGNNGWEENYLHTTDF